MTNGESEHDKPREWKADNFATFESQLQDLINRCSMENGSNTPDWILAKYLQACLSAWNQGVRRRETWYGRDPSQGPGG